MENKDKHVYPPVGHCIYCGRTKAELSDEHIIPLSLNGHLILPKSSCATCAKFTQKIEEVCTHDRWGMFAPFRARFGLPSRSGFSKKGQFTAEIVNKDGSTTRKQVKSNEYPVPVFGMRLPVAGILSGEEPTNKLECEIIFCAFDQANPDDLAPDAKIKLSNFRPTAYLQLLAKIGYAFAAAVLGSESLNPKIADIILGRSNTPTHFVGGGYMQGRLFVNDCVQTEYCHRLSTQECTIGNIVYTLAIVHLFGQVGLPRYHVVVRERLAN